MAAGLMSLVGFELRLLDARTSRIVSAMPDSAGPVEFPAPPDLALGPLPRDGHTTTRPLFRQDRRPPRASTPVQDVEVDAPEDPVPPPIERPEFHHALSAVVIAEGESVAYLNRHGESALTLLRLGDSLDGWRLVEVRPDRVVLEHAEERIDLVLWRTGHPAEPGQPTVNLDLRDGSVRDGEHRGAGGEASGGEVHHDDIELRAPRRPPPGSRLEAPEQALRGTAEVSLSDY